MTEFWISPDAHRIAGSHPLAADEVFLAGIEAGRKTLGRMADDDELREFASGWRVNYLAGQREERERWREILASRSVSFRASSVQSLCKLHRPAPNHAIARKAARKAKERH